MSEQGLAERMWRVLSPILLYGLLTMIFSEALEITGIGRMLGESAAMWVLAAENFLLLPIFWCLYPKEEKNCRQFSFGRKDMLIVVAGALCISRGINYLLALTFLPALFPGYRAVSEEIYHCSLLSQAAATVISAPLLEEVLVRGLIYGRLKEAVGSPRIAMTASALIFGVFHGNVVQGVYAFAMGLFFAQVYEASGSLVLAVLAHAAANGVSILAGRISWTDGLNRIPGGYYLLTAGYLLLGMLCWRYFITLPGEVRSSRRGMN